MPHTRSYRKFKDDIFTGDMNSCPCCFCGNILTRETATIEHIIPQHISKKYKNDINNLAISCLSCNAARNSSNFSEFRLFIKGFSAKIPIGINFPLLNKIMKSKGLDLNFMQKGC